MEKRTIIPVCGHPELFEEVAAWQSSKWNVPKQAYLDSMEEGRTTENGVPAWYVIKNEEGGIIAGVGVIENDFHKSKELRPNVCALFVEPAYRKQGLARLLLDHACEKLAEHGITTAYLCTDHTDFYERCGWSFHCMVEEDSGGTCRLYKHEIK